MSVPSATCKKWEYKKITLLNTYNFRVNIKIRLNVICHDRKTTNTYMPFSIQRSFARKYGLNLK